MTLTDEQVVRVNVALNEAAFLTIDPSGIDHGRLAVVLRPLSWDEAVDEPAYPVVHVVLTGVRRLWASYRWATWDDETVDPVPLDLAGLVQVVDDLGPVDLDGWTHIDGDWPSWTRWQHRPSLDLAVPDLPGAARGEPAHHLNLGKETYGDCAARSSSGCGSTISPSPPPAVSRPHSAPSWRAAGGGGRPSTPTTHA